MRERRPDAEVHEMIAELERLADRTEGLPLAGRLSDQARLLGLAYRDNSDRFSALMSAIQLCRDKPTERQFDLIHALEWALGLAEHLITPDGLRLPREQEK